MIDLGIVRPGSTIRIPFSSFDKDDGSAVTMTNYAAADILIYKDGSTTERASTAGFTATTDFDAKTGKHLAIIDLSDNTTAGFYAAGSEYLVAIDSVTIDGVTTGGWIARFKIGYHAAIFNTTIATLSSQTSFTLTDGPAEDDALNGMLVLIHDVASAVQCSFAVVQDYTGSTKTVTLAAAPTFTVAASDNFSVIGPAPLQPTTEKLQTAAKALDVSSGGTAGIDWANIDGKTTSNALTGTTIASTQQVDVNTIKTQTVTCGAGVTILANVGFAGAPGAANGGLFAGTNAATTFGSGLTISSASGTALVVQSGNSGSSAATFTGSGTGNGIYAQGGQGGHGIKAFGGNATGATPAGHGIHAKGGTASTTSGGTAGYGVYSLGGSGAASTNGAGTGVYAEGGGTTTVSGASGMSLVHSGSVADLICSLVAANAATTFLDNVTAWTVNITGDITGNLSGSVGSVTGNVGGNVTGTIGGLTAAALKDFFDTDSTTTYASAVAGSVVKEIADNAGGSSLTTGAIADAVWEESIADHSGTAGSTAEALASASSAGDPWNTALPGAYASGKAGYILGTYLDAAVSSRSTLTQTQVTGGAYSVQSSSCVLGDARIAHLDADVSSRLAPTTAGRTLDVTATGEAGIDWANVGGATSTVSLSNTTIGTLTTYTGNTPQTGDAYARLGAPAGASVSADVAAVKTDTGNLVSRITSTLFSGITSLAQWLGMLAGKQTGNSTARTEIRATGAGSGTYDETTDSQEALRDRGDSAWTTATSVTVSDKTGFSLSSSGLSAISTWTVAITGNITGNLSGSVGSVTGNVGGNVTGSIGSLATQAKADVNAEVDGALDTAIPATPTSNSINERIKTLDDNYTSARAGYLDNINNTNLASVPAFPTNFAALGINASGHVSRVTLVDTTTTNTDMRGTDGAALAATALSTAQWTNTRAGYLDNLSAGTVPTAAQITTAVLTTQMTEAYNADGTAPTLAQALFVTMQRLTDFAINSTTVTVRKLDGSTAAYTLTLDSDTAPTSSTRAT